MPCNEVVDREKIRLGFVSPDFGDHPVGKDMQNAFGIFDKSRITVRIIVLF